LSPAALESKFLANVACGGWDEPRARRALDALRGMRAAPRVALGALRG
jgi:hypothetical protein